MVLTVSLFHSTWNSFSFTPVSPGNSNLITYSFTDRFCLVFMAPVTNRSHVFNNQVVYNYKKQYYNLELSFCLVFMAPVTNRSHVFNNQVVYNYKKQYYNLELSFCLT